MSREFSVLAAKSIPLPGKGVKVLSRHVRVAVFNKNDVRLVLHSNTWQCFSNVSRGISYWKSSPKRQNFFQQDNYFVHCSKFRLWKWPMLILIAPPLCPYTHTHTQVLSNIHTVRAVWLPTEERSWKFSPRAQSSTDSLLHPVGVVRMNSEDTNIGESDWFQCVFFTSQLFCYVYDSTLCSLFRAFIWAWSDFPKRGKLQLLFSVHESLYTLRTR